MKRRGFTLVELLIVIAVIALLMSILMPALAKVRALAHRLVCGTNLAGLGRAMQAYGADNFGDYPYAGKLNKYDPIAGMGAEPVYWNTKMNWSALNRNDAFGPGKSNYATISASFYILLRGKYASTKQFVCKGDTGTNEFKLTQDDDYPGSPFTLTDAWDFGSDPVRHYSYAYNLPYGHRARRDFALQENSNPAVAVMADRNPFIRSFIAEAMTMGTGKEEYDYDSDNMRMQKNGNSPNHKKGGQNVLFHDKSVSFESLSNCGVNSDNIYTFWDIDRTDVPTVEQREEGTLPVYGEIAARSEDETVQHRTDSLLVNDPYTEQIQ